jgi:iron complex outermembrane receptor protein
LCRSERAEGVQASFATLKVAVNLSRAALVQVTGKIKMKLNRFTKATVGAVALSVSSLVSPLHAQGTAVVQGDSATTLPEVLVTGQAEAEPSYATTNAGVALKMDIPLLETPQAVSVVPRTLLDDQGVRKLEDALRNVAGVSVGGYYSDWDYYRIRGFDAAFSTYHDGLRGDYGTYAETYGLERVEVIKGPASSLYGQGPLGGMVNLVSKRPRPENFADVQFSVGSFNFYEPAADVGFVLNEAKTIYGRVTALYRDQDSFVDYANKQRVFVAPALTLELTPQTTLTFLTHFSQDWLLMAMPLPAKGTVLPNINGDIPMHRFIGDPDADSSELWRAKVGYEFKHEFNETFALRQNLSLNRMSQDWPDLLYPASLDANERTLYRYPYDYEETLDRFAVDTALESRFETGPLSHILAGGVDYYATRSDSVARQIDYADFPGSYPALDLFDPVYDITLPSYATRSKSITDTSMVGLYLQDHVRIFERLTVTLGGRYDWSSSDDDDAEGFSPRAGVTYAFTPALAVYGNYSRSFEPQWFSRDASGEIIDPETGENFEVGLKTSFLEGRLNTLLAVYHLTRQDVATANPATPDPFDAVAAGEQRSRGVELEGTFGIVEGLDLTAAYTYADAEITEDESLPVGARLQGVPEHAFSAWLRYTVQKGALKGFGVGLGGRYYTEQQGDVTFTAPFDLPAYGVMDAALFYRRGQFHAQVNFNNVLDEDYFAGAYNNLYVMPGEPLNVRATVGWSF